MGTPSTRVREILLKAGSTGELGFDEKVDLLKERRQNSYGRRSVSCTCRHVFHRKTKKQDQDDLRQRLQDQARKSREKVAALKRRPPIPLRRRIKTFQDRVR